MNQKTTLLSILTISLAMMGAPSLAQAKRLGGFKSRPSLAHKAPARSAVSPAPSHAPTPAAPVTPAPVVKGPSLLGTVGATAAGAAIGSVAGNAIAGSMNGSQQMTEQEKADAEAKTKADAEVAQLQKQLDEAKARQAQTR